MVSKGVARGLKLLNKENALNNLFMLNYTLSSRNSLLK